MEMRKRRDRAYIETPSVRLPSIMFTPVEVMLFDFKMIMYTRSVNFQLSRLLESNSVSDADTPELKMGSTEP